MGLTNFDPESCLPSSILDKVHIERFSHVNDVKERCEELGLAIFGLEIGEASLSLASSPSPFLQFQDSSSPLFKQGVAIMPGNEGSGLSSKQKDLCDALVFIPQFGSGTASLNVAVATGLAMYSCPSF